MKKIFKASSWSAADFTATNINNRSHWFVRLLMAALNALDIGTFSFAYVDENSVQLLTTNYGNFTLYKPTSTLVVNTPYIAYVNSVDKELFMCASFDQVISPAQTITATEKYGNFARGGWNGTGTSTKNIRSVGGRTALKFVGTSIIGHSSSSGLEAYGGNIANTGGFTISRVGCPLPDRWESLTSPITAVTIKYSKKPIINMSGGPNFEGGFPTFDNKYFNGIYDCDKYYLGALKSSDDKKVIYNGLLFDVDNANDITVV